MKCFKYFLCFIIMISLALSISCFAFAEENTDDLYFDGPTSNNESSECVFEFIDESPDADTHDLDCEFDLIDSQANLDNSEVFENPESFDYSVEFISDENDFSLNGGEGIYVEELVNIMNLDIELTEIDSILSSNDMFFSVETDNEGRKYIQSNSSFNSEENIQFILKDGRVLTVSVYDDMTGTTSNGTKWSLAGTELTITSAPNNTVSVGDSSSTDFDSNFEQTNNIKSIEKLVIDSNSNITIIDKNAFAYMNQVKEIFLPSSVEQLNSKAFYKCNSIEKINLDGFESGSKTLNYAKNVFNGIQSNVKISNKTGIKEGYHLNWIINDDIYSADSLIDLTKYNNVSVKLSSNIAANHYSIQYDSNSGNGIMTSSDNIQYDTDCNLSENAFNKEGYVFDGWLDKTTGIIYKDKTTVSNLSNIDGGVVTLSAIWKELTKQITASSIESYDYDILSFDQFFVKLKEIYYKIIEDADKKTVDEIVRGKYSVVVDGKDIFSGSSVKLTVDSDGYLHVELDENYINKIHPGIHQLTLKNGDIQYDITINL